jgi:hypothetical protein
MHDSMIVVFDGREVEGSLREEWGKFYTQINN